MPAPAEETGWLVKWGTWVVSGLLGALTVLGGRIVKKHDEEIASIKKSIKDVGAEVDKKLDKETWETNRREVRDNVIEIHRKIENGQRDAEARHRELMNILLQQRNARRAGD